MQLEVIWFDSKVVFFVAWLFFIELQLKFSVRKITIEQIERWKKIRINAVLINFFLIFFFSFENETIFFFSILFFQLTCSMEFSIFFINVARSFGSAIYGAKLFIFCSSLHFKSTKYFFLILCVVFFLVLLVSVIMSSTNRFRAYFYPIEIFSIWFCTSW